MPTRMRMARARARTQVLGDLNSAETDLAIAPIGDEVQQGRERGLQKFHSSVKTAQRTFVVEMLRCLDVRTAGYTLASVHRDGAPTWRRGDAATQLDHILYRLAGVAPNSQSVRRSIEWLPAGVTDHALVMGAFRMPPPAAAAGGAEGGGFGSADTSAGAGAADASDTAATSDAAGVGGPGETRAPSWTMGLPESVVSSGGGATLGGGATSTGGSADGAAAGLGATCGTSIACIVVGSTIWIALDLGRDTGAGGAAGAVPGAGAPPLPGIVIVAPPAGRMPPPGGMGRMLPCGPDGAELVAGVAGAPYMLAPAAGAPGIGRGPPA